MRRRCFRSKITAALGYHDEPRLLDEAHRPLSQWQFFVEGVRRLLAPNGRRVLELNENIERYGRLRWYDARLHDYFASVGVVAKNWITIAR